MLQNDSSITPSYHPDTVSPHDNPRPEPFDSTRSCRTIRPGPDRTHQPTVPVNRTGPSASRCPAGHGEESAAQDDARRAGVGAGAQTVGQYFYVLRGLPNIVATNRTPPDGETQARSATRERRSAMPDPVVLTGPSGHPCSKLLGKYSPVVDMVEHRHTCTSAPTLGKSYGGLPERGTLARQLPSAPIPGT